VNVTAFLPNTRLSGDYNFSALRCNDTSGSNPWISGSLGPVKWEGAALVVTYRNTSIPSTHRVSIFDRLQGAANGSTLPNSSFAVAMSTGGGTPFSGTGLFTQISADGQTGASFSNIATGETDNFNAVLLAGPGGQYPQSNWDGSNGWPQPELWDTHTMDVSFSGGAVNTDTTNIPTGDCIAAVAYVEQQGGS
jgi:hypothetical protein